MGTDGDVLPRSHHVSDERTSDEVTLTEEEVSTQDGRCHVRALSILSRLSKCRSYEPTSPVAVRIVACACVPSGLCLRVIRVTRTYITYVPHYPEPPSAPPPPPPPPPPGSTAAAYACAKRAWRGMGAAPVFQEKLQCHVKGVS